MSILFFALAGLLLCNGLPHLAAGLRGEAFPTPFAKPPGRGLSPPLVNFLCGSANLFLGAWLASRALALPLPPAALALPAAWLAIGTGLSRHFGRVRGEGFK